MEDKQTTEQENTAEELEQKTHCVKCEEYLAGWKRAQADYANLKKTTEREKKEFAKFANEDLLSALLPAIDQYEMALSFTPDLNNIPDEEREKLKNWIIGLQAVRLAWEAAFKEIGLERIPTDCAFDPLIHEAIGEEKSAKNPSGQIVRTMQSGWRLNEKLLRPAKVVIST